MIISKMVGGLGNQMFQYAYAKNLSLVNNTDFYLDTSFYDNQIGVTPRTFTLNKFPNVSLNLSLPTSMPPLTTIKDNFLYNPNEIPKNNSFLDGYWQSEKYFKKSKNTIIKDFSPNTTTIKTLITKYPQITNNTISLHIRRTDYLNSNGYHPVQTIDYYENAIDILGEYDNIFIFSDDVEWCKNNLSFDSMVFVEGNSDVEDLWLMSLCKNHIIVNSSFSWWGAYLNTSKNKKVIAPSNWFGLGVNIDTNDIVPDEWCRI
tara:strand:- start:207 stop:986 length:780 start_codon:yes stop_codon:yes gene_type:complete